MSKELIYIDPDDQPDWIKIRDLKERCRAIEARLTAAEEKILDLVQENDATGYQLDKARNRIAALENKDAVSQPSPTGVDVCEPSGNGQEVGSTHTSGEAPIPQG